MNEMASNTSSGVSYLWNKPSKTILKISNKNRENKKKPNASTLNTNMYVWNAYNIENTRNGRFYENIQIGIRR